MGKSNPMKIGEVSGDIIDEFEFKPRSSPQNNVIDKG
jgi:hypothetical protein